MLQVTETFESRVRSLISSDMLVIFYGTGDSTAMLKSLDLFAGYTFFSLYRLHDAVRLARCSSKTITLGNVLVEGVEEDPALFRSLCKTHIDIRKSTETHNKCILVSTQSYRSIVSILGTLAKEVHIERITQPPLEEKPLHYQQLPLWHVIFDLCHDSRNSCNIALDASKNKTEVEAFCKRFVDFICWKEIHGKSKLKFQWFLCLCAKHSAEVINYSYLARQCDTSSNTIKKWLELLENYEIITLIKPYYRAYSKRLLSGDKLIFNNTSLMCYLLQIDFDQFIEEDSQRLKVFKNWVLSELVKIRNSDKINRFSQEIYYWQDSKARKVDAVISHTTFEKNTTFCALSIGGDADVNETKDLVYLDKIAKGECGKKIMVHDGGRSYVKDSISFTSWRNLRAAF